MKKLLRISFLSLLVGVSFALTSCASGPVNESTGEYIDSASTTAKVKTELVQELGLSSVTKIEVSTYKGVVQLSGFVNNSEDIARAITAAKHVVGVKAVENSLLVKSHLK
jgi:osmotically-inducible protein OsmY